MINDVSTFVVRTLAAFPECNCTLLDYIPFKLCIEFMIILVDDPRRMFSVSVSFIDECDNSINNSTHHQPLTGRVGCSNDNSM